jgi:hypothetical protein
MTRLSCMTNARILLTKFGWKLMRCYRKLKMGLFARDGDRCFRRHVRLSVRRAG